MHSAPIAPPLRELRELLATVPSDLDRMSRAMDRVDDWRALLGTAREHGVAGVVLAAMRRTGSLSPAVAAEAERGALDQRREMLRQDVALEALRRVLEALARSSVTAVALKGPLLGARIYESGVVRPSTDLDLLIDGQGALEPAGRALSPLGYSLEAGPSGRFFRENHHHVHAFHPTLPVLELHFDAYRGFGTVLPAAPLITRSVPCGVAQWNDARVLSPEDEFLYLAVHGASHRFERLGWLLDLRLFVERYRDMSWEIVGERAAEYGFTAVVSFACELLVEWLGTETPAFDYLTRLGRARARAAQRLLARPPTHLGNAAAAFLFSALLCEDPSRLAAFAGRFLRTKLTYEMPMRVRSLLGN